MGWIEYTKIQGGDSQLAVSQALDVKIHLRKRKVLSHGQCLLLALHQPRLALALLPRRVKKVSAISPSLGPLRFLRNCPGWTAKCKASGTIAFCHPEKNLAAGCVLQHCLRTIDSIFHKHEPLIFKVGFTHDPLWRWGNTLYGYQHCKDRWSGMLVLFVSNEPYSPAMLEAALIERYSSIWAISTCVRI